MLSKVVDNCGSEFRHRSLNAESMTYSSRHNGSPLKSSPQLSQKILIGIVIGSERLDVEEAGSTEPKHSRRLRPGFFDR
jgi:hypothetical protein